ncbi:MAG: hypothetical protein KC425_20915 [Anaerolineales bacterium]|nr:hypothetical protein [Anaerolineales bacterium]
MNEPSINVEEIMQQIRREILAQQAAVSADGRPLVSVEGRRLPPEFYEHLYDAALVHDKIGVRLHVTRVNLPIVGPLLETLRTKLHELVIFYVNQVAERQLDFNRHLLQAVNLLAQHLEAEHAANEAPPEA